MKKTKKMKQKKQIKKEIYVLKKVRVELNVMNFKKIKMSNMNKVVKTKKMIINLFTTISVH